MKRLRFALRPLNHQFCFVRFASMYLSFRFLFVFQSFLSAEIYWIFSCPLFSVSFLLSFYFSLPLQSIYPSLFLCYFHFPILFLSLDSFNLFSFSLFTYFLLLFFIISFIYTLFTFPFLLLPFFYFLLTFFYSFLPLFPFQLFASFLSFFFSTSSFSLSSCF